MNELEAVRIASTMLQDHGCSGWTVLTGSFSAEDCIGNVAICYHSAKLIALSRPLVVCNNGVVVRAAIAHEVAHAIEGRRAGHGVKWQRRARELGGAMAARKTLRVEMP